MLQDAEPEEEEDKDKDKDKDGKKKKDKGDSRWFAILKVEANETDFYLRHSPAGLLTCYSPSFPP